MYLSSFCFLSLQTAELIQQNKVINNIHVLARTARGKNPSIPAIKQTGSKSFYGLLMDKESGKKTSAVSAFL
jgi:hypothetical protein